jgi:hypothetical protein
LLQVAFCVDAIPSTVLSSVQHHRMARKAQYRPSRLDTDRHCCRERLEHPLLESANADLETIVLLLLASSSVVVASVILTATHIPSRRRRQRPNAQCTLLIQLSDTRSRRHQGTLPISVSQAIAWGKARCFRNAATHTLELQLSIGRSASTRPSMRSVRTDMASFSCVSALELLVRSLQA